jgi:hypothetical protein
VNVILIGSNLLKLDVVPLTYFLRDFYYRERDLIG